MKHKYLIIALLAVLFCSFSLFKNELRESDVETIHNWPQKSMKKRAIVLSRCTVNGMRLVIHPR